MSNNNVLFVIPARLASGRLDRKILKRFGNKTALELVYEKVKMEAQKGDKVVIATDDNEVKQRFPFLPVRLTNSLHRNGTDRAAEVATYYSNFSKVLIVSADLPAISQLSIAKCAKEVREREIPLFIGATHSKTNDSASRVKMQLVKGLVMRYYRDSRSSTDPVSVGIYGFHRELLIQYSCKGQTKQEQLINVENQRLLDMGLHPKALILNETPVSLDTEEDYIYLKELLNRNLNLSKIHNQI